MDSPGITFADTEKAVGIVFYAQRAEETAPTAAPSGWGTAVETTTQATSAGIRFAYSTLNSEATSINAPAWTGNARRITTATIAFLPTAGVPPVTAVTVGVSATSVAAGETVTWTAEADGRVPVTYELTCDGVTTDNTTGVFTRTPTAGTQAWTLTATNASGTASASGSVTVEERLVFTPNTADLFEIEVDASSVVTGASYDLEWQTAAGGTATTVTQTSPTFTINFPASEAYRFRVRADGGAWSIYGYYAVQEVGVVTYGAENVQAVQISPLSAQAPVEMVPVTGKLVKLFEVQPPVATEVWGEVTHYLNGVMVNPSAFSGRGPQGWDSRKGDGGAIGGLLAGFDAALINTTWPAALSIGDTVAKAVSRPSALIPVYNSQGTRFGMIDQHSGLVVTDALSTSSPMQAAPAIIKHDTWTPGSVSLPGYADMAAIVTSTNLSTSGMSPPSATDLGDKVLRFDPSGKVLRGGFWQNDDNEPLQPYRSAFGSLITNYYAYKADAVALAGMFSDAYSSDLNIAMLQQFILRGLQWDHPNNDARVGAGISQNYLAAGALAKIAQGVDFLEYATTQRENAPFMYGFWDATTLDYLNPHNSLLRPTFSLRRQIRGVTSDASGHILEVDWNNNAKTGERKQRLAGLEVVLEATDTALLHRSPDYDKPQNILQIPSGLSNRAVFYIDGFYDPAPAVDDWIYCRIPAAAMANFVEGEPFWMYDTEGYGSEMVWDWQSFNPNGDMSYRSKQEPHGALIALHALGAYPDIPGSAWDAMKQYTVKTMLPNWPGTGAMDYPFTAGGFVGDFFTTHATTLGIAA